MRGHCICVLGELRYLSMRVSFAGKMIPIVPLQSEEERS